MDIEIRREYVGIQIRMILLKIKIVLEFRLIDSILPIIDIRRIDKPRFDTPLANELSHDYY